jgi:hypothetical protein
MLVQIALPQPTGLLYVPSLAAAHHCDSTFLVKSHTLPTPPLVQATGHFTVSVLDLENKIVSRVEPAGTSHTRAANNSDVSLSLRCKTLV